MNRLENENQKVELRHENSEKRSVLEMQDRLSEPDPDDEYNEFQGEGPNIRD